MTALAAAGVPARPTDEFEVPAVFPARHRVIARRCCWTALRWRRGKNPPTSSWRPASATGSGRGCPSSWGDLPSWV